MKKIKILSVLLILSFVSLALGQSVSEVWIIPADDANAAAWQAAGNARGIDFNANSTHTGNTVIIADHAGNIVHVHNAADGSYLWSLDTSGVGSIFTGHTVSPYRVAVTEDGQIFANSFDGIIVKWADDAVSTVPSIVIDLSGETGNSRSLEAVGSGNNVRILFSKGTDIRVFDDNGTGTFVESVGRTIATGWSTECEAIASADSNLVYASKISSGGDQKPFRRVYELTATGYVNNETLVAALPYTSWFQPNGLDVGVGYYILAEAAGAYDGFAIGTIAGANYNPESGDTDADNVYDGGMNGASTVADIAFDPTTLSAYWTTAGTGATAGIGCIQFNPPPTVFISELADPNNDATLRFVELYNPTGSGIDLTEGSGWKLNKYTNDAATVSQTLALTGTIEANGCYIIATGVIDTDFETAYGIVPDLFDGANDNVAGSNGDDNIELVDGTGTVVDLFGVPGEDGTGTIHEFEDGRAFRKATITTGNPTWDVNEWSIDSDAPSGIGPVDAPDGFDPGVWPTIIPLKIAYAMSVSLTEIEVKYTTDVSAVNVADYSVLGTSGITFTAADIDAADATIVKLTASADIVGDVVLDTLVDAAIPDSVESYIGITPIALTNTTNPGGMIDDVHPATFKGIISANDANNSVWISDADGAYNGALIHDWNFYAAVSVGDEVLITAIRDTYYNLTQLKSPALLTIISTGNTPYGPTVITGADIDNSLAADTDPAEKYEGQLVKITGAVIESYSSSDYEYTCTDDGGATSFRVGDNVDYHLDNVSMTVGETYDIIGVVDYSYGEYRINPRGADDIIEIIIHPEPEELYSWWEKNAGDYTFFQSDNNTRGMDLNPVTGHLLVASRTGSASIHILEGENGNYLGSMDMTNVAGGNFAINLVSVANDGVIYGCNLTATGAGFKFYRWGDESSTPTVAFEGDLDQRVGDSFTVTGSGANTIVYVSGSNVTKIYIFTTTDGISFSLFDEIPILSSLARGGIAPVADILGSDIWVNCSGKQAALIDTSGTIITTIDTSMNVYFAHIDYMETGDGRKLIAVAGGNCGDIPACMRSEVWDVTNPSDPWRFACGSMTNTPVANANGTGVAILEEKEDGVLNLYHLLSNNGIALYCEEIIIHPEPEELYSWWEKNAGDYTFFQSDNNTRGTDLNPVTGHLLVASRTGGNNIHVLEAENGTFLSSLDMTGVSGGIFPITLVSVANDGVTYGCNLTTSGTGFKFYRWGDESSAPTVAFEGDLDQRVGDSFTVIGSGANTIVYASGSNVTKIYVFTTTDGINFSLFDEVPIGSSLARGGIAPVADTLGSDIWVNCSGKQAALIDTSGTIITTIDTSMHVYFAHIDYMETGDGRKLIAVAGGNCGDVPVCMRSEVWDVTDPFNPWRFAYGSMTNTPVANVNGTGIAILEEKEDGVLNLYHLLSNNGIALYCAEEIIENTPPAAFHLISPENNATITFEDLTADNLLEVKWSSSFDIDLLDSVTVYEMIVLDESQVSVFDTIYTDTLNYSPIPNNATYKWFVLAKDTRGGITSSDTFKVIFDIQVSIDEVAGIPKTFALNQNYPNPFNPTTFIKYDLPQEAAVRIVIYDLMGKEVRTLVNEKQNAGYKSILWNSRDNNGRMVSSGLYIYQMITNEFQKTRKMMLLK